MKLFRLVKAVLANCTVLLIVIGASYYTYFRDYQHPPSIFWDENYHIASAQKYLNKVHFMELHPPLAKLLIAAGEALLEPNKANDQFIGTMYINSSNLPDDFSFAGYRFFPALLGWLTAPLFFLVLWLLCKNQIMAGLLSALYVFDNALIVHARGAMLDSILVFFIVLLLLVFLCLRKWKERSYTFSILSVLFGLVFGCILTTKLTGLIMVLLVPAVLIDLWPNFRRCFQFLVLAFVAFVPAYVGIWQIHNTLGQNIEDSLHYKGYFVKDPEYKKILDAKNTASLSSFLPIWKTYHFSYIPRYNKGVPRLNLCKAKENGSPVFFWPFGARSINYRWETHKTEKGEKQYKYLYLQCNPVIWFLALAGVLLAFSLRISSWLLPVKEKLSHGFMFNTFLCLYAGYMIAVNYLGRVMYLYHYFVPLIFGFILFTLVLLELPRIGGLSLSSGRKFVFLGISAVLMLLAYVFYAPLTYYKPLSDEQVQKLSLISLWDLKCAKCPRTNQLARALGAQRTKSMSFAHMRIGPLAAQEGRQDYGKPRYGRTVMNKPAVVSGVGYRRVLGTHSKSFIRYRLLNRYVRFKALAALPDYLKDEGGSVVFEVRGDGKKLWKSNVINPGKEPQQIDVSVKGVDTLELRVGDAGDGITHDHALWINPFLKRMKPSALRLGKLRAFQTKQDWGLAQMGMTVKHQPIVVVGKRYSQGFGVHANSTLKFKLDDRYDTFHALVGLPDYLQALGGSVVFEVYGDGNRLWRSPLVEPGMEPMPLEVSVRDVTVLELRMSDGGDGVTHDHGCWINPRLVP